MRRYLPAWLGLGMAPLSVVLLVAYMSIGKSTAVMPEPSLLCWVALPGLVAGAAMWGAVRMGPAQGSTYLLVVAIVLVVIVMARISGAFWYEFVVPADPSLGEPNVIWLTLPVTTLVVLLLALVPWAGVVLVQHMRRRRSHGA